MALVPGTRLGVYEVIDGLGAGGMGEVYRARDSKLGRSVAVKLLLDAVAADPDRVARFEREAKSLAALNHPHIAALYGLEQSGGRHFLVMELVEGETLAERIARGPLPLEQALAVAMQIAEALEAAHEKGIVHRDLKPANVKITPDERVKVLDFGLAKAMETESSRADLAHSPTLSMRATQAGVILGTAAYMSPEQAKGLPADQRSDVFSFGVVLFEMLTGRQPAARVTRFQFEVGPGGALLPSRQLLTLSPDGGHIVYVANGRLMVRPMAENEPRPIPGVNASPLFTPIFSPNGQTVAFASLPERALKKVAIGGGAPVTICSLDAGMPVGMTWSGSEILFADPDQGIMRVSSNGGVPEVIVPAKPGEALSQPAMLPGGEFVLMTITPSGTDFDKSQIVARSLKTSETKVLVVNGSDGRYVPTGHIVYVNGGIVFAVPFDVRRLSVSGGPVPVVEGVRRGVGVGGGAALFAFSNSGTLAFLPGPLSTSSNLRDIILADRAGAIERVKVPSGPYYHPRFSPDGKRLAFGIDDGKDVSIWIFDLSSSSSMRRLTFGGKDRYPTWSPDGQVIAFQSDRGGGGIFRQRADGTGPVERLTTAGEGGAQVPESWSSDGHRLLFSIAKGASVTLSVLSLPDKTVTPFADVTSMRATSAVFSPDGRWVAYATSNLAGSQNTVYVQPFPQTGAKYQITKDDDGHHPLWSPDGKELTFIPAPGRLVGVSVTTQPSFSIGNPVAIPRAFTLNNAPTDERSHDISLDGRRFVGLTIPVAEGQPVGSATTRIQVMLNWFDDLKARVPVQ